MTLDEKSEQRVYVRPELGEFSVAQMAAVLDGLDDACYLIDNAGRCMYSNEAAQHLFAPDVAPAIGDVVWDALPNVGTVLRAAHQQARVAQRRVVVGVDLPDLDRHLEMHVHPVGELALVRARSTSMQRSGEQAPRDSQLRLRQLTYALQDVFWVTDPSTRSLRYVSPSYEQVWGLPIRDLYQDLSHWRQLIHPEDREHVEQSYLASLTGAPYDVEYRIVRPDGSVRWIHDRALRYTEHDSTINETVGIAEDITEQKLAEAERTELLAREQAMRAAAQRSELRLARLQDVTAALGRALSPSRVADIVVEQGLLMLEARAGSMVLLRDNGTMLEVVRSRGYDNDLIDTWRSFPLATPAPIADAARLRTWIWLDSIAARAERYPHLHAAYPHQHERAWVAVPMMANERVVGALGLEFDGVRPYSREDCEYLQALAEQAAQALERTRLYQETQEALQASDETLARLNIVLSTAPIGMALWDTKLRYIHINQTLAKLNQLAVSEHIGRTLPDLFPKMARIVQPLLEQVLHSGAPVLNYEMQSVFASGREGDWLISVYPVRLPSGRIVGVGAAVVDITERKRNEASRALVSEMTAALAEALTVADVTEIMLTRVARALGVAAVRIARVSEDGDWLQIERAVGLSEEAAASWQSFSLATRMPLASAVRERVPIWIESKEERARQYPSGSGVHTLLGTLAVIPLIVNGRAIGGTELYFHDFRAVDPIERGFIHDVMQQCAQAYERARLYEAERQARATAETAVKARDQFLTIAAHELKTPLTSLLGNVQLLQRRLSHETGLAEREARSLQVIVAQSRRLNQMVMALLDVARIQGGQLSIVCGAVNLSELVEQVVTEIQPNLTHHSMRFAVPPHSVMVSGDELRLEQVLQNLFQNAVKYSPRGGEISVDLRSDAEHAWISVRDDGIGVPADSLPHLFQRFYRAENAEPQRISGMGIGLYVVREIVQLHGGDVVVESEEGRGSTFIVRLPLLVEPAQP